MVGSWPAPAVLKFKVFCLNHAGQILHFAVSRLPSAETQRSRSQCRAALAIAYLGSMFRYAFSTASAPSLPGLLVPCSRPTKPR